MFSSIKKTVYQNVVILKSVQISNGFMIKYINMYQFNYSFLISLTHACIGIIRIT